MYRENIYMDRESALVEGKSMRRSIMYEKVSSVEEVASLHPTNRTRIRLITSLLEAERWTALKLGFK